jgi:hypothetical protein
VAGPADPTGAVRPVSSLMVPPFENDEESFASYVSQAYPFRIRRQNRTKTLSFCGFT